MGGLSKNTKSIRKTDLTSQRNSVLGAKKVLMVHAANNGDTGIDLSALSFPTADYAGTGISGNPSYNEILKLNLAVNARNVEIKSSLNGLLMKRFYKVISSSQIDFANGYQAQTDEVFEIWFEPSIVGGATLVDGQPLVKTYLLPEGQTDVVTDVFDYNKFPTMQLGAVMVFRQIDPSGPISLMLRNINNEASGEGNYYELPSTDGVTNAIRFNSVGGVGGDVVTVVSVGSLVERPTTSIMAFVERINGDVDTLRTTVASLAGVAKSMFEDAPHSVDLATFGQRVTDLENTQNNTVLPRVEDHQTNLRQYTLTVTATNWTTTRAVGIPYQTLDGTWRLRFNIAGDQSPKQNSVTLSIGGVIFESTIYQTVAAYHGDEPVEIARTQTNSSLILIRAYNGTVGAGNFISCSGDVELKEKPTWI